MSTSEKTIAAQATAVGQGAIAVIRMSGSACLEVLRLCSPPTLSEKLKPRYAHLSYILDSNQAPIDQVLITYFAAPASYTGEDTVEISCHGGMLVTERVLQRLFQCGASPAEPGEFTKRAFLNGQLDLTQAEAVMDIISANNDLALKAAQFQLQGSIGSQIYSLRDDLIHVLAHIEAYIDFPDEDISPDTAEALLLKLQGMCKKITSLLATADGGRLLREGIRTVIVGPPNVGKSSLLNSLLGYERAIVSNIAGTTRDTVEERILIAGLTLRLIDTAGLRDSDDVIEQAGIRRTTQAISSADLVLEVVDASQARPTDEVSIPAQTPHIRILNKADLDRHPDWAATQGIAFSCLNDTGRTELETAIYQIFAEKLPSESANNLIAVNARHQHELSLCLEHLQLASTSIENADSPEFTALELREALTHLGEITGTIDTEDILGAIFSSFCLGK